MKLAGYLGCARGPCTSGVGPQQYHATAQHVVGALLDHHEERHAVQEQHQARVQLLLAARRLTLALASLLLATPALAESFAGRVVGVSDGDTISVIHEGRAEKVRLEGIDCPEGGQPFGRRAKQATSDLVFGRDVRVEVRGTDRYGRTIGRVFVGQTDVSLGLVRQGVAWHFKRYSSESALAEAENEARTSRRGLWADGDAIPPWDWRRARPRK